MPLSGASDSLLTFETVLGRCRPVKSTVPGRALCGAKSLRRTYELALSCGFHHPSSSLSGAFYAARSYLLIRPPRTGRRLRRSGRRRGQRPRRSSGTGSTWDADHTRAHARLCPTNFRDLSFDDRFRKYDMISIDARPARQDPRHESWKPYPETIVNERHLRPWKPRRPPLDPHIDAPRGPAPAHRRGR